MEAEWKRSSDRFFLSVPDAGATVNHRETRRGNIGDLEFESL
jgi:hypothetical protein